jgi:hypothetical protein
MISTMRRSTASRASANSGRGGIAERALPEADVVDRHVEVAGQANELGRVTVIADAVDSQLLGRIERPPVKDGDAGADASQRNEVDRRVADLRDPTTALGEKDLSSTKPIFCGASASFDPSNSGRPCSSERSATRAARFADQTDANVASASTNVPAAVASAEIVTQSAASVTRQA